MVLANRDVMEDQTAVDIVQEQFSTWQGSSVPSAWETLQGGAEKAAAEKLIQQALQNGSPDNITVIVIVLPWE